MKSWQDCGSFFRRLLGMLADAAVYIQSFKCSCTNFHNASSPQFLQEGWVPATLGWKQGKWITSGSGAFIWADVTRVTGHVGWKGVSVSCDFFVVYTVEPHLQIPGLRNANPQRVTDWRTRSVLPKAVNPWETQKSCYSCPITQNI